MAEPRVAKVIPIAGQRRRAAARAGPAARRPSRALPGGPSRRHLPSPSTEADLRAASATAGDGERVAVGGADQWDRKLADLLAFLRRRLTGDYEVDEYGFDSELSDKVLLAALRPLYRRWFRVQVRGIENVPASGGALVVANHSGTIALDSLMAQLAVLDEHPQRRALRLLGANLVFATPVVSEFARKTGSTLACNADAERLLSRGELVGRVPRGLQGHRQAVHRAVQAAAVRARRLRVGGAARRVPIVPVSIVGAEETYPILGNVEHARPAARSAVLPADADVPVARPARR